jgi:hypothetical protein
MFRLRRNDVTLIYFPRCSIREADQPVLLLKDDFLIRQDEAQHNLPGKVLAVDILSDKDKIYNGTILSTGKIAGEINANKIPDSMNHFINYPVDTSLFHYDTMNITKQRMITVCLVNLFIAVAEGMQEARLFKSIQLKTDCI